MQTLILYMAIGSLVSFLLSKINKHIGPVVMFALSIYALISLWNMPTNTVESLFGFENVLQLTAMGKYFAILSLIVFANFSFFNISWISKAKNPHAFNALSVITMLGTIGVFFSSHLIVLYIFWEIAVLGSLFIVPMGKEESRKATIWYVVISAIGTYMFLYGAFLLYSKFGTFNIFEIGNELQNTSLGFRWAVVLLLLSAGIAKSGIFPLHTWLRNVHGNAPDTFSAVLSGQLVKMGSYILALVLTVFPIASMFSEFYHGVNLLSYILIWLGNLSILIGTLMAIKQNDMKMLIAYSTVANGGYILIGLATLDNVGYAGGLFHVINHALAATMIFLSFAAVVYRTGTTKIDELGGLIHRMPITFVTYLVGIISLAGIPPTSGFISKWMIFQSLVSRGMFVTEMFVFIGSIGSFLYVFRPLAGVFLGQLKSAHKEVKEAPIFMTIPMIILVILTVLWGVFPQQVLVWITDIQKEFGMEPFKFEGTKLYTSMGYWDTWTVFVMFAVGFIIAAVIYVLMPKGKKIPLEDQYTSGEFLHNFDLYHYATKFYAFLEREYEGHPSFENLYMSLVNVLKAVGKGIDYFARRTASAYLFWTAVVLALLLWVRW
ncbi:proton-conducting transporter membrane subunit [Fervidobacterium nodosum]|uniref:NADH dehydrogenase (Quinone) n=1 Tax=Fervidobacterium nodosum (strain ATCC 35602 / DSM 5306 / Rt17-B1) TaxID=381764 RepID=A7HNU2_FERNB|nr:proton-conducting transporter membrane subunit [Fervidobacterium nodosum]ABS61575.1 NADH dehydrogenase (quinone) [Fervidobacterium nodosum Rt17-B1]PHJ14046.1 oxidoreductase [Fervidobacterium sp. SC_NGM5_G05]